MKKFFAAILTAIIFLTAFQIVFASNFYVGNLNSKIFHYDDCRWAQKMSFENRIVFNSRDEAINSGYRPCKKCSP